MGTAETFRLVLETGPTVVFYRWLPDREPTALIHVVHGWAEHALRYDRLAGALTDAGYAVYADDHLGHGQTGLDGEGLGNLGPAGHAGVVEAVHDVTRRAVSDFPTLPVACLGHSWGSFIGQRYLRCWADELTAAVLTGTTDRRASAAGEGPRPPLNSRFEPARTPYDWLSRDGAEVDRYVKDPRCGFEGFSHPSASLHRDSLSSGDDRAIPTGFPILIMNGTDDPVGGATGGRALAERYEGVGADVSLRLYEGARHELFNEINRDEVTADLLDWLGRHLTP